MGNYTAKLLEADLTEGTCGAIVIDSETKRRFIGGVGLAAKILWDETGAETEPLSQENPLMFMIGPLTGTDMPLSSRYVVSGISPLTGIWGEAHSGGNWGDELRHSGFEGIIVRGRSDKPVYLWVHNGEAEIRDARHLWGKDTYGVDVLIRKETSDTASTTSIGPAGERLVRISCIMNDGKMGRAAARCGFGALMGYKRLKAIAVKGTLGIGVQNEGEFQTGVKRIYELNPVLKPDPERYVRNFQNLIEKGGGAVRNFLEGEFEPGRKLAETKRQTTPQYCRHCPYSCGESNIHENGERHMVWESWGIFGLNCLVDNVKALQETYSLCNRYGLDTISTGQVVSFGMECFEKGLVTTKETGGISLTWGNHEAVVQMVREIGEKRGFGEILGDGVRRAAERIGGLAPEYAMHVKGLELPAHDPRATFGRALNYATSNLGATHYEGGDIAAYLEGYMSHFNWYPSPDLGYTAKYTQLSRFETKGKGEMVAKSQNWGCMIDSLVLCAFLSLRRNIQPSDHMRLLNAVTGWDMDLQEFMDAGERIFNLKRMLNVRRGVSRKDDTLPARVVTHKLKEGGAAGHLPFLGEMLDEYYTYRQWGEEGIPSKKKLTDLGLGECLAYGSDLTRASY